MLDTHNANAPFTVCEIQRAVGRIKLVAFLGRHVGLRGYVSYSGPHLALGQRFVPTPRWKCLRPFCHLNIMG
jgi:hypothetical protein